MPASRPNPDEILGLRLGRQLIERSGGASALDPADVVSRLCAMQAQDYHGALWSVGLRSGPGATAADVERAIAERRIVRTWPMRGTLHFVTPADVRWMLALLAPRVLERARTRHEQLGITKTTIQRARAIFTDALSGGHVLTRGQMMALLEADGIDTTDQRGYHILWALAQQAVLCCGPLDGKQQTFVLLDEWIPPAEQPPFEPPAALAKLTSRYFEAHGPATIADFAWWTGITKTEARGGIEAAASGLQRIATDDAEYWLAADAISTAKGPLDSVHLLPSFDEYFLGYTDRSLQLGGHRETYSATISANGMFSATVIIGGRVAGTWKRTLRRDHVDIAVRTFRQLKSVEKDGVAEAAERYGWFLGLSAHANV